MIGLKRIEKNHLIVALENKHKEEITVWMYKENLLYLMQKH